MIWQPRDHIASQSATHDENLAFRDRQNMVDAPAVPLEVVPPLAPQPLINRKASQRSIFSLQQTTDDAVVHRVHNAPDRLLSLLNQSVCGILIAGRGAISCCRQLNDLRSYGRRRPCHSSNTEFGGRRRGTRRSGNHCSPATE